MTLLLISDWNWFFSSVAQSVAAIVGIFAAILITLIANNRSLFLQKRTQLKTMVAQSEELVRRLENRSFQWHSKEQLDSICRSVQLYTDDESVEAEASRILNKYGYPRFIPLTDSLDRVKEAIMTPNRPPPRVPGTIAYRKSTEQLSRERDEFQKEGEKIDSMIESVQLQIGMNAVLLDEVKNDPERPVFLDTAILYMLVLYLVGVATPLGFLPVDGEFSFSTYRYFSADASSGRGLILITVNALFFLLPIGLWRLHNSLRYDANARERLKELTILGNYAEPLRIWENNQVEYQASHRPNATT